VIGAKNPKFCLLIPELFEAWPGCKFVVVHRPVEESVQSLTKLGWWRATQRPESLLRRFVETRDRDIAAVPRERVLHFDFADFLSDPRKHLEAIAKYAGVEPSPEQYQRAYEHVNPGLRHYRAGEIVEIGCRTEIQQGAIASCLGYLAERMNFVKLRAMARLARLAKIASVVQDQDS
jgi:hypothetical protein